MLAIFANGLVISGFLILIGSLFPACKLINQLPAGQVRRKWIFQSGMVLLFILGYFAYAVFFWSRTARLANLIVPAVFFFGAGFVWLTISLSLQTALDVRRVTLLERESITDPLIGVYNRRYLERRLKEEFDKARRYQHQLALLLIDIDHFKHVNDTYGHPAGDLVLRYWAGLILDIVRASDVLARFGGDEILIIAPNTSAAAALALAERICSMIESQGFVLNSDRDKRQAIGITVSIGVASLIPEIDTVEEFLKEVDRALYFAKRGGRNRAALSTQVLEKSIEESGIQQS